MRPPADRPGWSAGAATPPLAGRASLPRVKPRLLFRGLHAVIWHAPDPNRRLLEQYLVRLGLVVDHCDPADRLGPDRRCDILLFDSEQDLPLAGLAEFFPLVALVGSEVPSRLEWALANNAHSMICKPIRSAGIYGALVFAMNRFEERLAMAAANERLARKLQGRRAVVMAMLRLIRHNQMSEEEAFTFLRRKAMERRTTMEALCADMFST
ncbi:MAG: ANTAR domain-containing response regulator [Alkalilacustris sp.]